MPTESSAASGAAVNGRRVARGWAPLAFAAILGFAAGDCLRPPSQQALTRLGVGAIDLYRSTVSPLLERTRLVRCRFHPTCSVYGREAIARYGFAHGGLLAAGRVLRCHPFAQGGADPVP